MVCGVNFLCTLFPGIVLRMCIESFETTLTIQGLPKTPNELRFRKWYITTTHDKKWKRKISESILFSEKQKPEKPLEKVKIYFERHSSKQPDFDNLVGSFKPILDALVENGIIIDDAMKHMEVQNYKWIKCCPKKGHIVIRIESC